MQWTDDPAAHVAATEEAAQRANGPPCVGCDVGDYVAAHLCTRQQLCAVCGRGTCRTCGRTRSMNRTSNCSGCSDEALEAERLALQQEADHQAVAEAQGEAQLQITAWMRGGEAPF